jgi:hypothetical protein
MVGRCIKQTGSGFKDGAWEVSRESLKSFAPPLTARSPHLWQGRAALALFTRQALSHLVLDQNKSGIKTPTQLNFGKRQTASDKPVALLSPIHAIDGYNVPPIVLLNSSCGSLPVQGPPATATTISFMIGSLVASSLKSFSICSHNCTS